MPEPPACVVARCEGRRCVEVVDLAELAGSPVPEAEARALLARLAARFRAEGALGRLALLDRRAGAVVAARRVWP